MPTGRHMHKRNPRPPQHSNSQSMRNTGWLDRLPRNSQNLQNLNFQGLLRGVQHTPQLPNNSNKLRHSSNWLLVKAHLAMGASTIRQQYGRSLPCKLIHSALHFRISLTLPTCSTRSWVYQGRRCRCGRPFSVRVMSKRFIAKPAFNAGSGQRYFFAFLSTRERCDFFIVAS